jgi:hypothetical protein
MTCVSTDIEIEDASKKAIKALFGPDIENFKVREVFPNSSEEIVINSEEQSKKSRDSWDIQVTFLLNNQQYTVDLIIHESDGQVSYVRLIDKMTPL